MGCCGSVDKDAAERPGAEEKGYEKDVKEIL